MEVNFGNFFQNQKLDFSISGTKYHTEKFRNLAKKVFFDNKFSYFNNEIHKRNYNLLIFHELTKILNISRFEMGAINLKKTKLGFLKTKLPLLGNNNLG